MPREHIALSSFDFIHSLTVSDCRITRITQLRMFVFQPFTSLFQCNVKILVYQIDFPTFSKVNKMCLKYVSQYQDIKRGQVKLSYVHVFFLQILCLVTYMKVAEFRIIYIPCTIIVSHKNDMTSWPSG